jgi:hypothetical protein
MYLIKLAAGCQLGFTCRVYLFVILDTSSLRLYNPSALQGESP